MQHHHKHHVPDRKLALGAAFLMLQQATQQPLGTLIFEKFFSSRELDRVSIGILPIPRKITVGVVWSCVQAWLLLRVAIYWSHPHTA